MIIADSSRWEMFFFCHRLRLLMIVSRKSVVLFEGSFICTDPFLLKTKGLYVPKYFISCPVRNKKKDSGARSALEN